MNTETLGVYIIPDSGATLPQLATEGSACFDICGQFNEHRNIIAYGPQNIKVEVPVSTGGWMRISPGWRYLIPTGIILDIPKGFSVRLHARSGLALNNGIVLANSQGVIDSDYIDELMIMVTTTSTSSTDISTGIRLCQAELVRNQPTIINRVSYLPIQKTDRKGGFGSTGINRMEL